MPLSEPLDAIAQAGPQAVADPSAFAKYLDLETGVQQDGMEFLKLLLTHLEAKLAGSPQASLLEELYAGRQSFSTTCKVRTFPPLLPPRLSMQCMTPGLSIKALLCQTLNLPFSAYVYTEALTSVLLSS